MNETTMQNPGTAAGGSEGQAGVVAPQTTVISEQDPVLQLTAAGSTENTPKSEEGGNQVPAPKQTPEQNAVFASRRRKSEEEAAKRAADERQKDIDAEYAHMFAGVVNPITGQPIRSRADYDAAMEAKNVMEAAKAKGITWQQEQDNRAKHRQYLIEHDPEIRQAIEDAKNLREERNERIFADDLAAIKAKYPEESAEKIQDLGDDFIRIMAAGGGNLNALVVYEALRAQKQQVQNQAPPVIGDVVQTPPPEKEFFTSEELDRLKNKDLDDPKVFEKALKSLARLGKKN